MSISAIRKVYMKESYCNAINSKWHGEDSLELYAGGYKAIIIPKYGANAIALENAELGARLLREPQNAVSFKERPQVYGMPILFPPNRISGGRFEYKGRLYSLPINEPNVGNHIHGHLFKCPFSVSMLSADDGEARASLHFSSKSNQEFYQGVPNDFSVAIEFILSSEGLKNKISIQNESGFPLPLGLGFHTAFNLPFLTGTDGSDYKMISSVDEHWPINENHITAGYTKTDPEKRDEFRKAGLDPSGELSAQWSAKPISYKGGSFHGTVIKNISKGVELVYEVSDKFKFWIFWNEGGNKNFVCAEPQTWMINAPNCGLEDSVSGFSSIEENSIEHYESRIYLRK